MMITYSSVPLMGIVAVTVLGHLEDPRYLAGVGLAANFFAFFYFLFAFIRWSSTGLAAQAKGRVSAGAGTSELAAVVLRGLAVGLAIGLTLLALRHPLGATMFSLMTDDPILRREAAAYAQARFFGAPALLGTYALTGWFIGSGRPRAVLAMTLSANIANAALLVLFIEFLGYRSYGAGMAASLAEWLGLAIGLANVAASRGIAFVGVWRMALRDLVAWRALFTANFNILLKTVFTLVIFFTFLAISGRLPPAMLAGNLILMQFFYLSSYSFEGFSNACEAIAGQARGAGRGDLVRPALLVAMRCALATGALFAILYAVAGEWLIAVMTDLPEVRLQAGHYLLWMALVPLTQAGASVMDGLFVGTLRSDHLRTSSILAALAFVAIVIPSTAFFANHGLWFAFAAYFLIRHIIGWRLFSRDEAGARHAGAHIAP